MGKRALLAAALLATGASSGDAPTRLDATTWLVPGGFEAGHQPDGNSIVLIAPKGAIVVDTGRHTAHVAAIESVLARTGKPLAAIINTHWHLDHTSGNLALRARHPGVAVYASDAIDGALTGFLKSSAADARAALDHGDIPAPMADDVRADLATTAAGEGLRPDHVVAASVNVRIAGRTLRLNLARHAATAGDIWLVDARAKRVMAGDLVTLPVPFLDTACPAGWRAALDRVAATPFRTLVPGHGAVMDRAQFSTWWRAFGGFLDCGTDASKPVASCAAEWTDYAVTVVPAVDQKRTSAMAHYYAGLLRSGKLQGNCAA